MSCERLLQEFGASRALVMRLECIRAASLSHQATCKTTTLCSLLLGACISKRICLSRVMIAQVWPQSDKPNSLCECVSANDSRLPVKQYCNFWLASSRPLVKSIESANNNKRPTATHKLAANQNYQTNVNSHTSERCKILRQQLNWTLPCLYSACQSIDRALPIAIELVRLVQVELVKRII